MSRLANGEFYDVVMEALFVQLNGDLADEVNEKTEHIAERFWQRTEGTGAISPGSQSCLISSSDPMIVRGW